MRTEREGGKKRKERNNKELLFTTCSSLEKFQEKQLGRWKLSYLERMRRCSKRDTGTYRQNTPANKRQSLARTVKTPENKGNPGARTVKKHQVINDSQEHVPLKHTSWYTVAMTEQAVSSSSQSH